MYCTVTETPAYDEPSVPDEYSAETISIYCTVTETPAFSGKPLVPRGHPSSRGSIEAMLGLGCPRRPSVYDGSFFVVSLPASFLVLLAGFFPLLAGFFLSAGGTAFFFSSGSGSKGAMKAVWKS